MHFCYSLIQNPLKPAAVFPLNLMGFEAHSQSRNWIGTCSLLRLAVQQLPLKSQYLTSVTTKLFGGCHSSPQYLDPKEIWVGVFSCKNPTDLNSSTVRPNLKGFVNPVVYAVFIFYFLLPLMVRNALRTDGLPVFWYSSSLIEIRNEVHQWRQEWSSVSGFPELD